MSLRLLYQLRLEAGRNPHDRDLITLVGELSTQSELFGRHWASHDVKFHAAAANGCGTRRSANSTSNRWSCRPNPSCA